MRYLFLATLLFNSTAFGVDVTPETKIIELKTRNFLGNLFKDTWYGGNYIYFTKSHLVPAYIRSKKTDVFASKGCTVTVDSSKKDRVFDAGHSYKITDIKYLGFSFYIFAQNNFHIPSHIQMRCTGDFNEYNSVSELEEIFQNKIEIR